MSIFSQSEVWETSIVYERKAREQSWTTHSELIDSLINISARLSKKKFPGKRKFLEITIDKWAEEIDVEFEEFRRNKWWRRSAVVLKEIL